MPSHTLYVDPISAPCRAVSFHLALLGNGHSPAVAKSVETQIKPISLAKGEHKTPEIRELNPRQTVPTLVTPFGPLVESRAIMKYYAQLAQLANPAAWTFVPRTLFAASRVDSLLDWDLGTFYKAVGAAVYPFFRGEEATSEQLAEVVRVVQHLEEHLLVEGPFLTGERPTIADISIAMGATMLALPDLEVGDCPRVDTWMSRMRSMPGWSEVCRDFDAFVAQTRTSSDAESSSAPADEDQDDVPQDAEAHDTDPEGADPQDVESDASSRSDGKKRSSARRA